MSMQAGCTSGDFASIVAVIQQTLPMTLLLSFLIVVAALQDSSLHSWQSLDMRCSCAMWPVLGLSTIAPVRPFRL